MNPTTIYQTPPPEVLVEAVGLVVAHAPDTIAELDATIAKHRRAVVWTSEKWRANNVISTDRGAECMSRFLAACLPGVVLARHYEAVKAIATTDVAAPPTLGDEIRALAEQLREHLGAETDAALEGVKADILARLQADLAKVDVKLSPIRQPATTPTPQRPPRDYENLLGANLPGFVTWADARIVGVSQLLMSRASLAGRIARLSEDGDEQASAVAHGAKCVKLAGGRDALVGRVVEAKRVTGGFFAEDPSGAERAELLRQLALIDNDLAALGASATSNPPAGSHAAQGVADRKKVADRVASLTETITTRQTAAAGALVDQVAAGDAAAKERLALLVRMRPGAFATGLAEALGAFRWNPGNLDALAAELVVELNPQQNPLVPNSD